MMMRRTTTYPLVLLFIGAVLPGCERKATTKTPGDDRRGGDNVLLITLDTTRADRLGCYGYGKAATPALDALAARGTLFERAFAQVPLTLPSHCSIMTGRYPREHGVRDNARNGLGDLHPTLASVFKNRGYQTGAFVASFVLDSRFGLDRGFDNYNDDMGEVTFDIQPLEWQEPADVVTDRALEWLGAKGRSPFFCWVHYYDAHDPYLPPESFRKTGVHPYDGEIAFVDTQVKRLTDWLSSSGLADQTLIVVVGDHGESFDEHGERGHTNFVYSTNLHVPMIFVQSGRIPGSKRVEEVVELVDVLPTLFDLLGWKQPEGLLSRSLAGAFAGKALEERPSYSESQYVFNSYGWAEQRRLTTSRWSYISSTRPELYDTLSDPGETRNLIADESVVAANMREALMSRYEAMIPGEGTAVELAAEERAALQALGYLGDSGGSGDGPDAFLTEGLADPKDMKLTLLRFRMAREMIRQGEKSEEDLVFAIPLLEQAVEDSPNSLVFQYALGTCYLRIDEPERATVALREAIRIEPAHGPALTAMGDALVQLNHLEKAEQNYLASLAVSERSADTHLRLGDLLRARSDYDQAAVHYRRAVELMPTFAMARSKLGSLLAQRGEARDAMTQLKEAIRLKPRVAETHYNLGVAYIQLRQLPPAVGEFQEALRLKPDYGEAALNLGLAYLEQGALDQAESVFHGALSNPKMKAEAHYHLGIVQAKRGNLEETVKLYEKAIDLKPSFLPPIQELSRYYYSQERYADALRVLQRGVERNPDNAQVAVMLANLLATCPQTELRDGDRAVELAERAVQLTKRREPVVLMTLAIAYGESGATDKAAETAGQAVELAENYGQSEVADTIRNQVARYLPEQP